MAVASDFQSFIDEVIEKNDIVEIVSGYTRLKRVGSRFQGLCPLHNDKKSPSFSVSPDKQLFHCFGCGAGGTVIHFIMQIENLDFMEAVKLLADRAGIPVPDRRSMKEKNEMARLHEKKQRMYRMNADAGKFFHSCLRDSKYSHALEYLKKRGMKPQTITSFGIGYAPDSWNMLLNHLKTLGYSEKEIEECGLCVKRDRDNSYFDKFRNRIMFPIIDLRGNVIGFGGRITDDKQDSAKYLNSPETLIFKKKENLFAMNFAKNSKEENILLMEGYMDVIALHQSGITNAVASLGTAFTPEQAAIIKKYKGKTVLCYDSDEPGKKATLRAGEILNGAGIKTKVLTVVGAKDPDEYINKKGAEMFKELVLNAKNLAEYRVSELERRYRLDDSAERAEFIVKAAAVFSEMTDPVEREIYVKEFSRRYDISADAVWVHIKGSMKKNEDAERRRTDTAEKRSFEKRTGGRKSFDSMRLYNAEQLVLNLMCEKKVFSVVSKELSAADFSEGVHRRLAERIFEIHNRGEFLNPAVLISEIPPEDMSEVSKILSDDRNVDDKKQAVYQPLEIIKQIKNKSKEQALAENDDMESLKAMLEQLKKDKG